MRLPGNTAKISPAGGFTTTYDRAASPVQGERLVLLFRRAATREGPVWAVEHLKTLCCLGLKPESAMVALTPLLHEFIPHGWTRMALLGPDATIGKGYSENPATGAIFRERFWRFTNDRSSPMSLWTSCFHAVGIGWTLHMQSRGWVDSSWYREIEAPSIPAGFSTL